MSRAAFRSLDGVELALPVDGDRWVFVPRALAREEPDLIWALEYEDTPLAPQLRDELGGDPWLDYSDGALLVPIERWNARAAVESALVGGYTTPSPVVPGSQHPPPVPGAARPRRRDVAHAARVSIGVIRRVVSTMRRFGRVLVDAVALMLALSFAVAVVEWIVVLRDGMSGTEVGNGAVMLPSALALAALSGRVRFGVLGRTAYGTFRAGAATIAVAFAAFLVGHAT